MKKLLGLLLVLLSVGCGEYHEFYDHYQCEGSDYLDVEYFDFQIYTNKIMQVYILLNSGEDITVVKEYEPIDTIHYVNHRDLPKELPNFIYAYIRENALSLDIFMEDNGATIHERTTCLYLGRKPAGSL